MMDQQARYASRGLSTEYVGEEQTDLATKHKVLRGEIQLVFITPESIILNSMYRKMLRSAIYMENLAVVLVDEAHCVKTWGDAFRTAFAKIGDLRSLIPSIVNVMALTANATSETFLVVKRRLSMDKPTLIALTPLQRQYSIQSSFQGTCRCTSPDQYFVRRIG